MSITVLLIAAVPAVLVIITAAFTESRLATIIAGVAAIAIGLATGNPAYAVLDVALSAGALYFAFKSDIFPEKAEAKVPVEAPPPPPPPPPPSLPPEQDSQNGFWSIVTVAACIIAAGYNLTSKFTQTNAQQNNSSLPATQYPEQITAIAKESKSPESFAKSVEALNDKRLIERSKQFNKKLHTATKDNYFSIGYAHLASDEALNKSLHDAEQFLKTKSSNNTYISTKESAKSSHSENRARKYTPCVYKDVMSDADYRACGARPPQNDPNGNIRQGRNF